MWAYLDESKQQELGFIGTTEDIARAVDGAYAYRLKSAESLGDKLGRKGRPLGTMNDTLGSTILANDEAGREAAIAAFKRRFPDAHVDDFRDRPTFLGYRGVHADVPLPNGQTGEMQFHTNESFAQKEYAHTIYDTWRKYIEHSDVATLKDFLAKVPEADQNAALEDVTRSVGIYDGRVEVPEQYRSAAARKTTRPASPD